MRSSRDRWVLGATVVLDSAWLFPAFGVLGAAMEQDGSPLSWPAVLAILVLSLVVARVAPSNVAAIEVVYLVRSLIGATAIYLAVATHVAPGVHPVDLGWIVTVFSESAPDGYTFRVVAGSLIGVALWWRGTRLAIAEFPTESLTFSVRLGVPFLALATAIDIAHPASLNTFPMIFIFFASALGGLSIGHLLPESQQAISSRTWPKVIAGVVSTILLIGLVISVLHKGFLSFVSAPLLAALSFIGKGLVIVIVAPIILAFNAFVDGVIKFFDRPDFVGEMGATMGGVTGTAERLDRAIQLAAEAAEKEEEAAGLFPFVIQVVEWVFLALVTALVLYLLWRVFRILLTGHPEQTPGQRESLAEEANPISDVARLLGRLIPDWLRLPRRRRALRLPDGPPGVIQALRIYYEILSLAEQKGHHRPSHETATEFQSTLENVFPGNLVRMATEAFNRAFYGNHPASMEQIAQMRSSLANIRTAMRMTRRGTSSTRVSR